MALGAGGGSAKGIRAGAAYVELNGKDNLTGFLGKMKSRLLGAMKMMAGAAVLGIGAAVGAMVPFKDTADDLTKMRDAIKAMGMSATGGSGLFGVLNQFSDIGENVEGLTQFSQKVQDAMSGVGGPTGEAAKLFDGLIVSAKDLADLPLDEKFLKIHEAIRELPQAQQQFKLSMLGGTDSMKKWLPLLSMSNAELREQAKNLAFGAAEMEEAAQASKAMREAGGAVNRVWQQTVVMFAPIVRDLAKGLTEAMKPVVEWFKGRTLVMIWEETVARLNLGWEEIKLAADQAWIDVGASAKIGLLEVGEFIHKLTTKDFWTGLSVGAAVQFAGVSRMFTDLLNGMRGEAVKIGGQIADVLTDPRKLAMIPLAPLAAPMLAENLLKEGDAEVKRQMEQLMKDMAAGKFGALTKEGIRAEAEAAKREAAAGVEAARANLAGVMARIEEQRKQRRGDNLMDMEIELGGRGALAKIGRAMGTFGGGSFLTQGFGVQSAADPVKKMVEEQKKTVVKLGEVVDAVQKVNFRIIAR